MTNNLATTYSRPLIILHWGIAALVFALLASVELHEAFPEGSAPRALLIKSHFWLGLLIGLLTLVRLGLRFGQTLTPITPAPALWQARLASAVMGAFYIILLLMPLLGYALINAKGFDLSLLGLSLGHWVEKSKELADQIGEIHETLGNVFIALVALHTAAALYHHHVLKDSTFSRVRPPA